MGVPGWMTDPEHDDEPTDHEVLPTGAYYGTGFERVFPSRDEVTEYWDELVRDERNERGRAQRVVAWVWVGSLWLIALGLLFVPAIPWPGRVGILVMAALMSVFVVLLWRRSHWAARLLAFMDGGMQTPR